MDIFISGELAGKTVLQVVKKHTSVSAAHLKKLKFMDTGITVDGERVTVRYLLKEGQRLSLATEDTEDGETAIPVELPLDIVYEDENCTVPSKPADMPTHQSHGHYGDTVANALTYRYSQMGLPFVFRPVNRLDRNTSGLLLIARDRISAATLTKYMQNGLIKKEYVAILRGAPPQDSGIIDTYMRRTEKSVIVREVCDACEGADRAITKYTVLHKSDTHSLVLATPITGRTHQLRVHFASLGCPIEGDDLYGQKSPLIDRHALHSYFLEFPAPESGDTVRVTAPMHKDMQYLANAVFGDELYGIGHEAIKYILPKNEEK